MPRVYDVAFDPTVAITAAQDLAEIKGVAGKMLRILRVSAGEPETALPTAQSLSFRCRVLPATVTDGSGGTTPTPAKNDQGDVAASFSAFLNNTTKATTSGTAQVIETAGSRIESPYDVTFPRPPTVMVNQAFVFELVNAPTGTIKLAGVVTVEEWG
ncbi:MAG TPA: hypothetical protein VG125_04555 [Pirellulales bacterium]|nr:hypothetical protein [Pirellulales bacterium]